MDQALQGNRKKGGGAYIHTYGVDIFREVGLSYMEYCMYGVSYRHGSTNEMALYGIIYDSDGAMAHFSVCLCV